MYNTLQHFHEQFATSTALAYTLDLSCLDHFKPRQIVYAGMGGSTLAADLFLNLFSDQLSFPIIRDYQLPTYVNESTLVICASFSGNTEETISCFEQALAQKSKVIVLANGGKLKDLATQKQIPYFPIPDCIQPRCSIGYFFAGLIGIFKRLELFDANPSFLENLANNIKSKQSIYDEQGLKLAQFLKNKIPILYGPTDLWSALRISKIKINENAKVPAFYNVLPELNHNEMMSYTQSLNMPWGLVYVKTKHMHPRIAKRIEVMHELMQKDQITQYQLELDEADLASNLFAALMIVDYASYHLAISYGIDPVPVALVESFKKRLN